MKAEEKVKAKTTVTGRKAARVKIKASIKSKSK